MMKTTNAPRVAFLLLLSLITSAWSPVVSVPRVQRERKASSPQQSTPAKPTTTPVPSPTAAPQQSPSPATLQLVARSSAPAKSLAELQGRITDILKKPELQSAMIGVKVVSLDSGHVLFEENSEKLLRPASNMKIYTVATAIDRLTPDFRFTTSV